MAERLLGDRPFNSTPCNRSTKAGSIEQLFLNLYHKVCFICPQKVIIFLLVVIGKPLSAVKRCMIKITGRKRKSGADSAHAEGNFIVVRRPCQKYPPFMLFSVWCLICHDRERLPGQRGIRNG